MITEDYVNFEIAKLLRDKGFEQDTVSYPYYTDNGNLFTGNVNTPTQRYYNAASAPTIQMAMKWLRKVHNLIITIDYDLYEMPFNKHKVGYGYSIQQTTNPAELFKIGENIYDYYEEACEAAIKYCLTNLI